MSSQQFTLEYLIKMTGGAQAAGQINQVNNSLKATSVQGKAAANTFNTIGQSAGKMQQNVSKTTGHLKGIAFGMIGLTSAGVEAIGMLGMWQDTAKRTAEAQQELTEATKTYGEDSTQATRATQELTKAQRFQNMTQRNLILSMFDMVPFTLLLVNGIREQALLTKQLAAEQKIAATVQRALAVETQAQSLAVAGQATAMKALSPLALQSIANTQGMGVAAATAATNLGTATKATGGFRVALTGLLTGALGKIAIVLAAIAVAIFAWNKNWLGVRDAINAAGVAIGNAIPQLKPLLAILSRIGLVLDAIAEGRFGDIPGILSGANEGLKESSKSANALNDAIGELNASSAEFVRNLAAMDKKEMKATLFDIGAKGGAGKRLKDVLKDFNKLQETVVGFGQALQTMRQVNVLEKWGFDVPDSLTKKIFFTFQDRFKKLGKMLGGEGGKLFTDLSKMLGKAAKDNSGKANAELSRWLVDHPGLIKMLSEMGFEDEAKMLQTKLDEGLKDWWKGTDMFNNTNPVTKGDKSTAGLSADFIKQFPSTFGVTDDQKSEVDKLVESIKNAINGADWSGAAAGIRAGIVSGLSAENFQSAVTALRIGILDPFLLEARKLGSVVLGAIKEGMAQRNTSGNPLTDAMNQDALAQADSAEFLSQIFFGMSKEDMKGAVDNFFINTIPIALRVAWTNAKEAIQTLLKGNPLLGTLADIGLFLLGDLSAGDRLAGQFRAQFDLHVINPILKKWEEIKANIGTILKPIVDFFSDPIGSIIAAAKAVTKVAATAATPTGGQDIAGKFRASFDLNVVIPIQKKWEEITTSFGTVFKPVADFFADPLRYILTALGHGAGADTGTPMTIDTSKMTIIIKAPEDADTGKWTTWGDIVEQEIGAVWTKLTAFINYLHTSFTTTIPVDLQIAAASFTGFNTTGQAELSSFWTFTTGVFSNLFITISAGFTGLANTWSVVCNSFGANAQSGANQIIDALTSAMDQVSQRMDELANNWSTVCNSMIKNAQSAAKGIISALNKIPKTVNVTVHVGVSGPGVKFLAGGYHGVVDKPTLMVVGEAGPERVDVSKTGGAATGLSMDRTMNITPDVPRHSMLGGGTGDTIVQVFLDGKRVQGEIAKILIEGQAGYR